MRSKADVARKLAADHFRIEEGLERIFIIGTGLEDPNEPIKLLEVNANTFPTGSIEPFSFSSTKDVPFTTQIAEISPDEFQRLQDGRLDLPVGWTLVGAEDVPRPQAA